MAVTVPHLSNYTIVYSRLLSKPKVVGEVSFITSSGVKKCQARQLLLGFFDEANNKVYQVDMTLTYSKRL